MSQRNKSRHQARKPAGDGTKRVRWVVAGGLVLSGVLAFAVFGLPRAHSSATASADLVDNAAPTSADFAPTVPNKTPAPAPAPEGMVWIPGGEFSMGSDAASESLCGLPGVTRDALPIHRVYVDGFWMDATEVTNEQFEKFVKATGYVTVAETEADEGRVPHRAAGESRRRFDGLHADAAAGAAEQLFPMVELRARRELASSHRAGQRPQGPREISGGANRLRRRGGLREVGGQAAAHGGGVGVRRARRCWPASCMRGAMS